MMDIIMKHIKKLCEDFYLLGTQHGRTSMISHIGEWDFKKIFEEQWEKV